MTVRTAAAALLVENRRLLLGQRLDGKDYAYHWCTPGGKVDPGESLHDCVVRECKEEVGLDIQVTNPLPIFDELIALPQFDVRVVHFHCRIESGKPMPIDGTTGVGWFTPEEVARLPLAPSVLSFAPKLREYMQRWEGVTW